MTEKERAAPGLLELAWTFNHVSLMSFGGGLSAWARRVVVEEKRWLSDEEFLSALTLSRVLPGANQVNFAVYVGNRFRGASGAAAAVLGLTVVPFLIILGMGIAYFNFHAVPAVQSVLRGVAAAAVGLALSMGCKTGEKFMRDPVGILLGVLAFIGSVFLKMPLFLVLLLLGPPAYFLAWRRAKEAERK